MEFLDQQIRAPKSWSKFEDLCRALFAAVWNDPQAHRNGRTGQPQHGVDVYGVNPHTPGTYVGVQCKGKDSNYGKKATRPEFDAELRKAEGFDPPLAHWTFATTSADDAALLAHTRRVTAARVKEGKFPVDVQGWDSLQALLAQHPHVIEQFYPELGSQLAASISRLDASSSDILAALKAATPNQAADAQWLPETFGTTRDLGPALMGHPLGPADVGACPELPEVSRLWQDLERGFSARLVGSPGAGKSVCALQVAKRAYDHGWRVVRLKNPKVAALSLMSDDVRTLHIIDDAHLIEARLLHLAEQRATGISWLLSAHTLADEQAAIPGSIRLNAIQAVAVIAAGLKANLAETQRVVQRIDDRIGDGIGSEWIEHRMAAAERAERPWQFCFILGGGWRRAANSSDAARAAGADLVLAAAAIHQLASRDARCREPDLQPLFDAAGIDHATAKKALDWLLGERLLLAHDDLRCPHQRLSSVLIGRILKGQQPSGRVAIGAMLHRVIDDPGYPFAGLYVLLQEWRLIGEFPTFWTGLIEQAWLLPLIERCWEAEDPPDRSGAGWLLAELQCYLDGWPTAVMRGHEETAARWYSTSGPGAAYSIGHLLGQVGMKDRELARVVVSKADPISIAHGISQPDAVRACEIANMVLQTSACRTDEWNARYLAAVDRPACLRLMSDWPADLYLSAAGTFCQHFTWDDQSFGLGLIEALVPAIANQLRARPLHAFRELHDMIWHSLRLQDTLGIYSGKNGPTSRMRKIGAKFVACWAPSNLSEKLSAITRRDFQAAWQLLDFVRNVSRKKFEATVAQIDWAMIDATIGDAWAQTDHEIEVFLHVCFQAEAAKTPVKAMIAQNLPRIGTLPARLAMLAPESAIQEIELGHAVGLVRFGHFQWQMSAALIAQLAETHPDLIEPLVRPHVVAAGSILSHPTQPFFGEPLLFLRLVWQFAPVSFEYILDNIDCSGAARGWQAALAGGYATQHAPADDHHSARANRHTASWLIERTLSRDDGPGKVAFSLRRRFPARSLPPAELLEPFRIGPSVI